MMPAFTCYQDFTLYQTDVKSVLLNEYLKKEAYVKQPLEFDDQKAINHVNKLYKALYGLKHLRVYIISLYV